MERGRKVPADEEPRCFRQGGGFQWAKVRCRCFCSERARAALFNVCIGGLLFWLCADVSAVRAPVLVAGVSGVSLYSRKTQCENIGTCRMVVIDRV